MLIIDGHNLIPKVPGLSLADMDDEAALIERLQVYARGRREKVYVFFDGAPPGHDGLQTYGVISAIFVPKRNTADNAIRSFLDMHKREARGARVVSSDRQVRANAKECGAVSVRSDEFARELMERISTQTPPAAATSAQKELAQREPDQQELAQRELGGEKDRKTAAELEEWYRLFGIDAQQAEQPIEPPEGKRHRRAPSAAPMPPPAGKSKKKPSGKQRRFHGYPPK